MPGWLPSTETLKIVGAFAGRRLAFGLAVLVGIIYISYLGFGVVSGTPAGAAAGQALLDTGSYLGRLVTGNLGQSLPGTVIFRTVPVTELLPQVVSHSLGLLGATFLVSILVGIPLGAVAAYYRHSRFSLGVIIASIIGISTPSFFAALFLQIAAIAYTRNFGQSIVPVGGFGWDKHLVLPMLVLAARPVAQITRITYVSLSEILDQDYVRTAHSKGLRSDHVFMVHVVRNALVPILTTIAVSLRFSLSSLPVVEVYFGWGGIGQTLLASIFNLDADMSIALFLVLGLLFILVNLALELTYYLIDPRLRDIPAIANRSEREGPGAFLGSLWRGIKAWVRDNPLSRWLRARKSPPEVAPEAYAKHVNGRENSSEITSLPSGDNSRWRAWRRGLFGNLPLTLGAIIVGGLLYLMVAGPTLAPYSPSTTQQIAVIDGVISTPPFPPSTKHIWGTDPLGRDMLSLILAGVQQTIILAISVVIARLFIGFILGALAGWFHDTWIDRLITGLNQAIAVYPTLLLAALLILIVGLDNGMRTFVIALSLVGWGEIMQFVRGEMINIRPKPFIESAVAIGQRTYRLILMHVLPNLAPALISLAALEVGAVLLLLGELGFLGFFIRGSQGTEFGLFSQVPEWGALLSGVRTWTRSYPWTGLYPTAAFFIAILGFNLLGEGIRRFFSEVGLVLKHLVSPYTLALVLLAGGTYFWARNNTGELVFYRQQAEAFDGNLALEHVQALAGTEMAGRALDAPQLDETARYIRDQFDALGLQPGGESMDFYQTETRQFQSLDGIPLLVLDDGGPAPVYLEDYSVYPKPSQNTGHATGDVRVLALGPSAQATGLDLAENVVLALKEADLPALAETSCRGVLVVADDLSAIKRRYTQAAKSTQPGCGQDTPVLYISERLAGRLLQGVGITFNEVEERVATLRAGGILDLPLSRTASIEIQGSTQQVEVFNIIGQLPGSSEALDERLIIVAVQYDNPPTGPEGIYPGANDNASAVGVLLETIRVMQTSGYQPLKTFLFVAYSGEGLPDLATAPEVQHYLTARSTFQDAYEIEGVIYLRGMAVGQEDTLAIWTQGKVDLAKRVESAVHLSGLQTVREDGPANMNLYAPGAQQYLAPEASLSLGISRQGWERSARLATDNLTFVRAPGLRSAGEAVTLTLMVLGR